MKKKVAIPLIISAGAIAVIAPLAASGEFDWPWAQQMILQHEQRITALEQHDGVPTPSSTPSPATTPTVTSSPAPAGSTGGVTVTGVVPETSQNTPGYAATPAPATPAPTVVSVSQRNVPKQRYIGGQGNNYTGQTMDGYDSYCDYQMSDGTTKTTYLGWASKGITQVCPSEPQ